MGAFGSCWVSFKILRGIAVKKCKTKTELYADCCNTA
jgi:hypothetical protein